MTNTIKEAEIISNYLSLIKKSLPLSVRLRKNELEDILDEIEEHIWEKVIESAGDKEPTEIDIQIAISQIGEPEEIAAKFVGKSTPYIYISEELYPSYRKFRKTLFWSSLIWLIMFFVPHPFIGDSSTGTPFIRFIENPLYNSLLIMPIILDSFFIFTGIVFCYLSITGYVPSEIRTSKLQKRYFNPINLQKPLFKPILRFVTPFLSLLFLFSAIFLFLGGYFSQSIPFFVLSIVKLLQGFIKRKLVIWQKILILMDIFYIGGIVQIIWELIHLNFYELRIISNFISILSLFYVFYDIYTFYTLRHKKELYLKELNIIDRLHKKESMFRDIKSNNIPNTQIISSKKNTFSLVIEEKIEVLLKKAKKKLPLWLKISEKREVINEIEEEIRENVLEFEESNKLTEENVNQLFSEFEIYISNEKWPWDVETTPKIYISKEVWPWYFKTLKAVFAYFIIIAIFVFVLSIIVWINIPLFLRIILLVLTFTVILVTRAFIFLSLKGFNISRKKSLKKGSDYRYSIWETLFAVIYLAIGIIIFFDEITPSTSLRNLTLILIVVVLSFLLGGIKLIKVVFIKKQVVVKSFLIIIIIIFSLLINVFVNYHLYSMEPPFIRSILSINMLSLLSLLINIEILYELFHLFFQEKNKKQKE